MPGGPNWTRALALSGLLLAVAGGPLLTTDGHADTLDPCSGTLGAATVDNHLCLNGETIKTTHPETTLDAASKETSGDMTFVLFTIIDHGRWVVMQQGLGSELTLDPDAWTDPLPAGSLALNTSTDAQVARVHLATPLTNAWHDQLEDKGVDVLASRPGNWIVANVSNAESGWVTDLAFVDGVEAVPTGAVLDDRLDDASGLTKIEAVAWERSEALVQDVCRAIINKGGVINPIPTSAKTGIVEAKINASNLTALADNPAVGWIQPGINGTNETMDNIRSVTGTQRVQDFADASDYTGEDITGMVVAKDGVYEDHEELNSSVIHYHDRDRDHLDPCNVPTGKRFLDSAIDDTDKEHGTPVFGIIYADGNRSGEINNKSADEIRGMAPNASGVVMEHERLQRLQEVVAERADHGITFASYSWKYVPQGPDEEQPPAYTVPSMENDLVVQAGGVSVYQSMDNEGPGHAAPAAVSKNALSVGGLYHEDDRDLSNDHWREGENDDNGKASTGPTMDGRLKPDLVGPYDLVDTTAFKDKPGLRNHTSTFQQTSAATPVVAGAGALVEQMFRESVFSNATMDPTVGQAQPALVKALLINSAYTFDPDRVNATGLNSEFVDPSHTRHLQGWGLPNVSELETDGREVFTVNETLRLVTGARYLVGYDVPDHTNWLRVTLAWTDPATPPSQRFQAEGGNTSADENVSALVNDLDLEVKAPDGTTYLGNGGLMRDNESNSVDSGSVGYPVTDADRVNNVENVFVNVTDTGNWTTTVKATGVPVDAYPASSLVDQPFALVIRPVGDPDPSGGGGGGSGDDGGGSDGGEIRCPTLPGCEGLGEDLLGS